PGHADERGGVPLIAARRERLGKHQLSFARKRRALSKEGAHRSGIPVFLVEEPLGAFADQGRAWPGSPSLANEPGGAVEADIVRRHPKTEPDDEIAGGGILQPVGDLKRLAAFLLPDVADRLLERGD